MSEKAQKCYEVMLNNLNKQNNLENGEEFDIVNVPIKVIFHKGEKSIRFIEPERGVLLTEYSKLFEE